MTNVIKKTIHKSYLLICSLYFNDNINNVVKKRIIRIRYKNYNRKQLTNKFDEKKIKAQMETWNFTFLI